MMIRVCTESRWRRVPSRSVTSGNLAQGLSQSRQSLRRDCRLAGGYTVAQCPSSLQVDSRNRATVTAGVSSDWGTPSGFLPNGEQRQ
eukprot:801527-Rhodomonas_salina.1